MNLTALPQRIEIAFWKLAVQVMKKPSLIRMSLVSLVLVVGCVLGWTVFSQAKKLDQTWLLQPANLVHSQGNPPVIVEGTLTAEASLNQSKILVVIVDQIAKENPELETVWLASYVPGRAQLALLPLFPVSITGGGRDDRAILNSFGLDDAGNLSGSFFEMLQSRQIKWDHYLVLDHQGLALLMEFAGGFDLAEEWVVGVEPLDLVQSKNDPSPTILEKHSVIIRSFCRSSEAIIMKHQILDIFQTLGANIQTDLSEQWLVDEWLHLRRMNTGLTCEFPNLKTSTSIP